MEEEAAADNVVDASPVDSDAPDAGVEEAAKAAEEAGAPAEQPEEDDAEEAGASAESDAAYVASTSGQQPAPQQGEEALPEQQQQQQEQEQEQLQLQPPPEENQVGPPAQPTDDQQESTSGRQEAGDGTHRSNVGDGTYRSNMTYSTGTGLDSKALHSEMRHNLSAQASSLALSSRPATAALGPHLRGSRPNSAAIAATIEGFENDYMGIRDSNHILDEAEDDGLLPAVHEVTTEELIAEKQQKYSVLLEGNEGLQQRVRQVLDLRNKGRTVVTGGLSQLEGADTRYRAALKSWVELRKEQQDVVMHHQTKVFEMKSVLEGRIQRAEEVAATLKHFKREVALAAEHSKSGKPISEKLLTELEAKERVLEEEVQRVRLKHIHLANALKKLESTIVHKEQLAEGLHLIDFEQLKIENQSLNEKIEERNEELVKLRKKTTVTVQILTHMKAKLAFIESENKALTAEQKELDAALKGKRDELASLKGKRDRLWQQQRTLKEGSVFVTNPMLLQDMQAQRKRRDDLMAEIELLKQQHAAVMSTAASVSVSASDSRGASPLHTAGRLKSPLKNSSSKAGSVKLLVASAHR